MAGRRDRRYRFLGERDSGQGSWRERRRERRADRRAIDRLAPGGGVIPRLDLLRGLWSSPGRGGWRGVGFPPGPGRDPGFVRGAAGFGRGALRRPGAEERRW